jgi:hypothetical protein
LDLILPIQGALVCASFLYSIQHLPSLLIRIHLLSFSLQPPSFMPAVLLVLVLVLVLVLMAQDSQQDLPGPEQQQRASPAWLALPKTMAAMAMATKVVELRPGALAEEELVLPGSKLPAWETSL